MHDDTDWLVLGDFICTRYPHNRSREGGNTNDMMLFNEEINNLALVEIPLKGRRFTWSNMQEAPLLEKLDWCFSSVAWTLTYPATYALPLAKTTSNHTPIMIKIATSIPKTNICRFENCWLEHHQFKEVVKELWDQDVNESDSAKTIAKFKRLGKGLKIWSRSH